MNVANAIESTLVRTELRLLSIHLIVSLGTLNFTWYLLLSLPLELSLLFAAVAAAAAYYFWHLQRHFSLYGLWPPNANQNKTRQRPIMMTNNDAHRHVRKLIHSYEWRFLCAMWLNSDFGVCVCAIHVTIFSVIFFFGFHLCFFSVRVFHWVMYFLCSTDRPVAILNDQWPNTECLLGSLLTSDDTFFFLFLISCSKKHTTNTHIHRKKRYYVWYCAHVYMVVNELSVCVYVFFCSRRLHNYTDM